MISLAFFSSLYLTSFVLKCNTGEKQDEKPAADQPSCEAPLYSMRQICLMDDKRETHAISGVKNEQLMACCSEKQKMLCQNAYMALYCIHLPLSECLGKYVACCWE
uniref:Anaphylatoxin-like domain-containing protein n=1 Tax=Amphiprion ocellaris TaxID=80972 RepID=A0AAQ5ZZP1_AMPOC